MKKLIIVLAILAILTPVLNARDRYSGGGGGGGADGGTFVVAASDSLAAVRTAADYKCDGVADEVQIEAALAALPAQGGTVFCAAGAYVLASSVTIPDDNITLKFEPGSTITITDAGGYGTQDNLDTFIHDTDTVAYSFYAHGKDQVIIDGVSIDWGANGADQTKFTCVDTNYAGIALDFCTNSIIQNCKVENVVDDPCLYTNDKRGWGVVIVDCCDVVIDNCIANDCGYEGFGIRGESRYCVASRCKGKGSGNGHFLQVVGWSPTVDLSGSPHHIIVRECRSLGDENCDEILAHGNIINDETGITNVMFLNNYASRIRILGNINNVLVDGNIVERDGNTSGKIIVENVRTGTNASIRNVVITNNILEYKSGGTLVDQTGVEIVSFGSTGDAYIDNVVISNNMFRNTILKVRADTDGNTDITNVKIDGNLFLCNYTNTTSQLIFTVNQAIVVSNVDVTNNVFKALGTTNFHPVWFYGVTAAVEYKNFRFDGNTFDADVDGSYSSRILRIDAGSGSTINGLTISNNLFNVDPGSYACYLIYNGYTTNDGVTNVNIFGNTWRHADNILYSSQAGKLTNVYVHDNHFIDTTYTMTNANCSPIVQRNIGGYITCSSNGMTLPLADCLLLDSDDNAVDATLPDGTEMGQRVIIRMTNADNESDISVTHHETSDPEVFLFDAVDEYLSLEWTGTEWVTIAATATP